MSMTGIPELRSLYRQVGGLRFWMIIAPLLLWIFGSASLTFSLDFPSAYGSSCERKCALESYWYSPVLISETHRAPSEIILFVLLWFVPASLIAVVAWSWIAHFRRQSSDASNDSAE
jgi:hypothetical protein